jgi:transposase
MHISRKPGEQLEVDWAGQTATIIYNVTGEIIPAYVFVAVLSSSGYAYVEAFLSQEQESWAGRYAVLHCSPKQPGLLHMLMLFVFLAAYQELLFQTI